MAAFNSKIAALTVVGLLIVCLLRANGYTMENMCEQWWGEGYIGNPTDCNSWGYCQKQKVISRGSCGKGLVFDSASSTCQYNYKVACSTSVASTCSALTNPAYMADPSDCSKYAYCFGNGKSQIQKCPAGQVYAANNNSCIWGPTCPQNSICRFMPNNIYVGDPTNCGSYLQCLNGYGIPGSCPSTHFYNAATGNCETTNPCTNNGGNPTDGDSNIVTLPPSQTACTRATTTFVTDKATCYGFYSCSPQTMGVWGTCPYGTIYNPSKNQCVSPNAYPCWFNRCQNTNLTYAALKNTGCEQYVYCPNGAQGTCPSGYPYFDEVYQKCVPNKPSYAICTQTAVVPSP
ncbi:peritrophin-44 isoform X1 [Drosophila innubila]|uniref:peritrophin-44 isoform X1 n=1 Tax=Drosophila innubila TaxID=198719 RepID=UPI00148CB1CE|nr:peritrophin-44 isoform X1 [Drosophila innubila]